MQKPIILVPIPVQDHEKRRYTLSKNYVRSLVECNAVPVLVPTSVDQESLHALYVQADGVLLTGGGDVEPSLFGEAAHPATADIDLERDEAEITLACWALQDNKPAFAICRGIQVVNVALGGTLVQDIPDQWQATTPLEHRGYKIGAPRDQELHDVCIDPNTRISRILGVGNVSVNSFHHQALKALGDGLVVTSRAPDGVIESVEAPDKRWYIGVQWHPEDMTEGRADMRALFQSFVDAAVGNTGNARSEAND
jgi:putative glutamine amidotransferase